MSAHLAARQDAQAVLFSFANRARFAMLRHSAKARSTDNPLLQPAKTMNTTQRFTLNPDYKAEQFDEEVLLYSVSAGQGVYLNETAFLVWEMCARGLSVAEMAAQLEAAYPEQQEVIGEELATALDSLLKNGIIHPAA
jgi:hypothetical protein